MERVVTRWMKEHFVGLMRSLIVMAIGGAAGWMSFSYNLFWSMDRTMISLGNSVSRTNEILEDILEEQSKMHDDVKSNTSYVIKHEEKLKNVQDRVNDHQRFIDNYRAQNR